MSQIAKDLLESQRKVLYQEIANAENGLVQVQARLAELRAGLEKVEAALESLATPPKGRK